MTDRSKIEWTDATWNPIRGCSRVSEGCRNCYAERMAERFSGPGQPYEGVAFPSGGRSVDVKVGSLANGGKSRGWTGEVQYIAELLHQPLWWKRPRKIFVNSMSDLFHEKVHGDWIDRIIGVMRIAERHTFQILTKRPERMLAFMKHYPPLSNVWLGVSVEDQKTVDERIPLLLQTPAAIRWVSYEPALGPVDFSKIVTCHKPPLSDLEVNLHSLRCVVPPHLDWIVAGGESGPGARPAHPDWFRTVRDHCLAAGVPFFFKQWGEWLSCDQYSTKQALENLTFRGALVKRTETCGYYCCEEHGHIDHGEMRMIRVGKKRAGHLLDGKAWQEFPC